MSNGNLKGPLSPDEAREQGSRGGRASGEARRRKKNMRERLAALMEMDRDGMEGADALALALFERALGGDVRAFETVMTYLGDPPRQTVKLPLPRDMGAASLPGVTAAILAAVARGRLTPDDAARLATVVGAHVKAVETGELADRITALEDAQDGQGGH